MCKTSKKDKGKNIVISYEIFKLQSTVYIYVFTGVKNVTCLYLLKVKGRILVIMEQSVEGL